MSAVSRYPRPTSNPTSTSDPRLDDLPQQRLPTRPDRPTSALRRSNNVNTFPTSTNTSEIPLDSTISDAQSSSSPHTLANRPAVTRTNAPTPTPTSIRPRSAHPLSQNTHPRQTGHRPLASTDNFDLRRILIERGGLDGLSAFLGERRALRKREEEERLKHAHTLLAMKQQNQGNESLSLLTKGVPGSGDIELGPSDVASSSLGGLSSPSSPLSPSLSLATTVKKALLRQRPTTAPPRRLVNGSNASSDTPVHHSQQSISTSEVNENRTRKNNHEMNDMDDNNITSLSDDLDSGPSSPAPLNQSARPVSSATVAAAQLKELQNALRGMY